MYNKEIGGYFGLELTDNNNLDRYWKGGLLCNSGRNGLEYILLASQFAKIWIPYYTCDVLLEPLKKHNISYEFYDVNDELEPIFDFSKLKVNDAFLYTNYFGLKDKYISTLVSLGQNLIIDNAQALFSPNHKGINTFYSPRKFLGCSDGGIVFSNNHINQKFENDSSEDRVSHLIKRIESGAEVGYGDFKKNDKDLDLQLIKNMSLFTKAIINNADFNKISKIRKENFAYLHKYLEGTNLLKFDIDLDATPMVYPYRTKNIELKNKLISSKIFCATYWPNVLDWCDENFNSYMLANEIIALPIDQRYEIEDLDWIIDNIK